MILTRISIHAPHAGRDSNWWFNSTKRKNFNPRAPCGARPSRMACATAFMHNFNPRAPCGARRTEAPRGDGHRRISIHAPHAGRDRRSQISIPYFENFNPRAPCGARLQFFGSIIILEGFQSTRPMRGATKSSYRFNCWHQISIHAPHAGRDSKTAQFSCAVLRKSNSKFNATDNLQAKYACGIVQTTRAYPYFRCEAPGKSLSACASHSDHQHTLRLIAGP